MFEAPKCLQNRAVEASEVISTKTLLLKLCYRRPGNWTSPMGEQQQNIQSARNCLPMETLFSELTDTDTDL